MIIGKKHNRKEWVACLFGIRLHYAIVAGTFFLPDISFLKLPYYICGRLNVLMTFNTFFPSDCRENLNCHHVFIKTPDAYHRMLRL